MPTETFYGFTWDPTEVRDEHTRMRREARAGMLQLVELRPLPAHVHPDGTVIWVGGDKRGGAPSFQFDEAGQVRPAIAEANRVLRVDDDPWGALAWWLNSSFVPWGRFCPVSAVGTQDEWLIPTAARYLMRDPD